MPPRSISSYIAWVEAQQKLRNAVNLIVMQCLQESQDLEIGIEHLLQSRTEEAIVWLEKARSANPLHLAPHAFLASAYGLKGEADAAAAELAEARRLVRDGRFSSIARLKAIVYWGVPKTRALLEATYFTGLRKAGVPEE